MNKSSLFFFALLVMGGFLYSDSSITIVKPGIEPGKKFTAWTVGSTQPIKWKKNGPSGTTVSLQLYNSTNTSFVTNISSSTPNSGSFSWPIPSNLNTGKYVIRLETSDQVKATSIIFKLQKVRHGKNPDFKMHPKKTADLTIGSVGFQISSINKVSTFQVAVNNIGDLPYWRQTCSKITFYYYGINGDSPRIIQAVKRTDLPKMIEGGKYCVRTFKYTFTKIGKYSCRICVNPPECRLQTGPDPDSDLTNNNAAEKTFWIKAKLIPTKIK